MSNLEAFIRFVEKFKVDYINPDSVVSRLIDSPHANFDVTTTDGGADITGGRIYFSFKEMGFCVLVALEGDSYYEEDALLEDIDAYDTVFAPFNFPNSTELVHGKWWGRGTTVERDKIAALYLYFGFCKGVQDPTQSEEFLEIVKEMYK